MSSDVYVAGLGCRLILAFISVKQALETFRTEINRPYLGSNIKYLLRWSCRYWICSSWSHTRMQRGRYLDCLGSGSILSLPEKMWSIFHMSWNVPWFVKFELEFVPSILAQSWILIAFSRHPRWGNILSILDIVIFIDTTQRRWRCRCSLLTMEERDWLFNSQI